MAIQDSDPERRNLMVTSLAFIAYFFGGGSVTQSTIKLPIVNIEFSNATFLAAMAWAVFAWFIYRYWLAHHGKFLPVFKDELYDWRLSSQIENYLTEHVPGEIVKSAVNQSEIETANNTGNLIITIELLKRRPDITYIENTTIRRSSDGVVGSYHGNTQNKILSLEGIKGWIVVAKCISECFFNKPSFSDYIVPYLLASAALTGAALSIL